MTSAAAPTRSRRSPTRPWPTSTRSWPSRKRKSCRCEDLRVPRLPRGMTLPRHIAIIMDGNGRWATARGLPRQAGHKEGVEPVRMSIRECVKRRIGALTLFAFSSENWGRPGEEVGALMGLFVQALEREVDELHANGVRLTFIGDRQGLPVRLQTRMATTEQRTAGNTALRLQIVTVSGGL